MPDLSSAQGHTLMAQTKSYQNLAHSALHPQAAQSIAHPLFAVQVLKALAPDDHLSMR
jgi:hypothetical protein